MADLNPTQIYTNSKEVYTKARDDAHQRSKVLRRLYDTAVEQLGYSQPELENNTDAQKEVAKLMFSEELAGNKELNPLLETSPFYKDYAPSTEVDKQHMHRQALGTNYGELVATIERYNAGFGEQGLSLILQQAIVKPHEDNTVDAFVMSQLPASLQGQKDGLAGVATQYPLVGKVDPNLLDSDELKRLAGEVIKGEPGTRSLEHRVGVKSAYQ